MRSALALARRGLGAVWPNPAVGCVLVRPDLAGRVVGRGWTQAGGRPHAETEALRRAGPLAKGATAYVTLEPCSHVGETGSCADALVDAGISRVVAAMEDPDPRVSGRGVQRLCNAGVAAEFGPLAAEAAALNAGFVRRVAEGRPEVTIKIASTADGRIATRAGTSRWITGAEARRYGHLLRARHDAVLTGMGTIEADDPMLTCRIAGLESRSPVRVILDPAGRLDAGSALAASADDVPVWRFRAATQSGGEGRSGIRDMESPAGPDGRIVIDGALSRLGEAGITRLLVEAGPRVTTSFIDAGFFDAVAWFRAPDVLGGDGKPAVAGMNVNELAHSVKMERIETIPLGRDILEIYRRRPGA